MADKENTTRFVPDYAEACMLCGQCPTVRCEKNGVIVHDTDLCGPCVWGESEALDPDKWND